MTGSTSESLKQFLSRTPFFGGLEDAALTRLVDMLVPKALPAGAEVFKEGDAGRSMYIIASGEVVMCKTMDSGHRVRLVRLGKGDIFGETTLIEMQARPYTASVDTSAVLYELTNACLYKFYKEDVHGYVMVLQNINRELCRRLRREEARLSELAEDAGEVQTQIRITIPTKI